MRVVCLIVAGALALASCTPDFAKQNDSNVIIRVRSVEATAGGEGQGGAFLLSDVHDTKGGNFNDNVVVTVENIPKNNNVGNLGKFNDVLLEQYDIRYVRSDGRAVEGVDVPYRITGQLSALVPVDGNAAVAFVVVRHQAKDESPLVNITGNAGAEVLTVFAHITLYGHTTSGKAVQTTATLSITFGDFVKATA